MPKSYRPRDLHAQGRSLALRDQGFFWTGLDWTETSAGPALRGQTYVEYWIPERLRSATPLILIHGGGGQGTDMLGTPDGRQGWVHAFLRAGHPVYVIDRPGHGRSPHHPEALGAMGGVLPAAFLEKMFTKPEAWPEQYPNAKLHDKWPGGAAIGTPEFDAFLASAGPMMVDLEQHHRDCQRGIVELLEKTGPAILLTHSAGAPTGWLAADARPDLVRAIMAVEPVGPPFAQRPTGTLSWGITAAPLTFDPPANSPEDIARAPLSPEREGDVAGVWQAEPARQLVQLAKVAVTLFTAEASWMAHDNHLMAAFLRQAGVECEHVRLEDHGLHGNGHAMMLETNSDDIATLILRWIEAKAELL